MEVAMVDDRDDADGIDSDEIVKRILCDTVWIKGQLQRLETMLNSLGASADDAAGSASEYRHVDRSHRPSSSGGRDHPSCDP
jgi:hypothetical protein